jgi:acyl-ACP thioesterase
MDPEPGRGRVHEHARTAGIGEAAPGGTVRLDAVADWLQDVAYGDVLDAGLDDGLWVVRRATVDVVRAPVLGERVALRTWCSAFTARVAERRTDLRGEHGAQAHAVAVWVHLDPATGAPARLDERFAAVYGPSAGEHRPDHRLRHPSEVPADAAASAWMFRAADLDVAGHVNNAAYWQVLADDSPAAPVRVQAEHRAPAASGPATVHRAGDLVWVTGADGELHATFRVERLP